MLGTWYMLSCLSIAHGASCALDTGMPAELTKYVTDTRAQALRIKNTYSNICGTAGLEWSSNKLISSLEKAYDQVPMMNSLSSDFMYNVVFIYNHWTPKIVLEQGKIFETLEKSTLYPTLETLSQKCQLDGPGEKEIIALIQRNNDLQDFFKKTVVGTTGVSGTDPLKNAIAQYYSPEATQTCTDKDNLDIEKRLVAIEKFWWSISKAKENWDEAIRMIKGWSIKWQKSYNQRQKQIFREELRKQWLGQNSINQMMKNLECAQQNNENPSLVEQSREAENCKRQYVIWYEKVVEALDFKRWKSKTSDIFSFVTATNKKQIRYESDILKTYAQVRTSAFSENNSEAITNETITNLLNIHISIVTMNQTLEKRTKKMQENCMKWSVGERVWCFSD